MRGKQPLKDRRIGNLYFDRRSGDDRRKFNDLEFFEHGGIERRSEVESRQKRNHGVQSVNGSRGSNVCPETKSQVIKWKIGLKFSA
jgi:hypothetical protein